LNLILLQKAELEYFDYYYFDLLELKDLFEPLDY